MDIEIKVITKKPKIIYGLNAHEGKIKIGDFSECFYMPINWWSLKEYKRQWKEGLEQIQHEKQSCLVTTDKYGIFVLQVYKYYEVRYILFYL